MVRMIADLTRMKERHAAVIRHTVDDDGVEIAAYHALFELANNGPMRSSELAERTHADPSTTSRHVTTLVDLGHAERSPDPRDRRASLVSATDAGVAKVEEIKRYRAERLAPLLEDWTDDDIERFVDLGTRVLHIFEESIIEQGFERRSGRCVAPVSATESATPDDSAAVPTQSKGPAR